MSAPGIVLAAPASGSGKTAITLALLRALREVARSVAGRVSVLAAQMAGVGAAPIPAAGG